MSNSHLMEIQSLLSKQAIRRLVTLVLANVNVSKHKPELLCLLCTQWLLARKLPKYIDGSKLFTKMALWLFIGAESVH